MPNKNNQEKLLLARTIDFIVLGSAFYLSCMILTVNKDENLLFQTLIYTSVILFTIGIGRGLLGTLLGSLNSILRLMLFNAVGLGVGAVILSILSLVIPQLEGMMIVIIISSIIAFFILGTLTPLLMHDRHTSVR